MINTTEDASKWRNEVIDSILSGDNTSRVETADDFIDGSGYANEGFSADDAVEADYAAARYFG